MQIGPSSLSPELSNMIAGHSLTKAVKQLLAEPKPSILQQLKLSDADVQSIQDYLSITSGFGRDCRSTAQAEHLGKLLKLKDIVAEFQVFKKTHADKNTYGVYCLAQIGSENEKKFVVKMLLERLSSDNSAVLWLSDLVLTSIHKPVAIIDINSDLGVEIVRSIIEAAKGDNQKVGKSAVTQLDSLVRNGGVGVGTDLGVEIVRGIIEAAKGDNQEVGKWAVTELDSLMRNEVVSAATHSVLHAEITQALELLSLQSY